MRRAIAVIGPGDTADETLLSMAYDVGARIARADALLVCGGLSGVMAAACRGAKEAGGTTIGILPGADPASANEWVDVPIATGLGEGRNFLVVRAANGVIAVGGSWGTFAEIALACRTGVPVVTLQSWSFADGSGNEPPGGPVRAADPAQAVDVILHTLG